MNTLPPAGLSFCRRLIVAVAASPTLWIGNAVFAQACPNNFFDVLESKTETTVVKQNLGEICKGRDVRVRGTLTDVAKRGDLVELHLASAASGNMVTIAMRDPPGADLAQIRKGAPVTIDAKMRDFSGAPNEYIILEDGRCADCR